MRCRRRRQRHQPQQKQKEARNAIKWSSDQFHVALGVRCLVSTFHFTSFRLNISSCLFLVLLVNSHTSVLRSRNVSNGLVVIGYSLCCAHFHYADRTRLPFLQIAHSQTHAHTRGGIWNGWQFVHIECNAQQCVGKERKMNEWWNKKKSIYNKWANEWMNKKSAWTWRQSFIESFFSSSCFCFNSICWFEVFDYTADTAIDCV